MTIRAEYIAAVGQLVPGDVPLTEPDKILAIGMAVKEHSRMRPRVIIEDVAGDGGFDYALSDLAAWAEGFSSIRQVEYPVDDDDETPDVLAGGDWMIYEKPAGKYLRFLNDTPSATEDMRITYTALHTVTDAAGTINAFDDEAVQALAASYFAGMLATYYAQSGAPTIAADSVDHSSRAREYAARAKALRKVYFDHLGVKDGQAPAASITMDQDKNGSWGRDRLTHPGRHR